MAIQTQRAYVLRTFDLRETSKIASLFTEHQGKIKGIFKGIRVGKKNFVTTLDVGSLNEVVYYPSRKELWLVSYADQLSSCTYCSDDLEKMTTVHYMLELVDKIMPMHLPSVPVYHLLEEALTLLENNSWMAIVYIYQVRLLELSGFRPSLKECTSCGSKVLNEAFFSARLGGLLCSRCAANINDAFKLSSEVLASLIYIQNNDFKVSLRLRPTQQARTEMRRILDDFFQYHTNTRIRSLKAMSMA